MRPGKINTPALTPGPGRLARRRSALIGGALALLFLGALAGCSRGGNSTATQITVAGSTSVTPFAEQLAEEFMRQHRGQQVNIQGIGSSAGIQATQTGAADIGMSSRALQTDELAELEPIVIALDALAVIVHPDNPVENLTLEQVRRVFAGEIANWRELGGPDAPITLVNREAGSGTRGAFEELVMGKGGPPLSYRAIRQGSNGSVRAVVEGDPVAIGYISLGVVSPQVRALRIDGVEASAANVSAGRYKLVRPFLFVTRRGGTPGPLATAYLEYVLGEEGQRRLAQAGLVPAPRKDTRWKR